MSRDQAKKNNKKSSASESSKSSYMEEVAEKLKTIKSMALGKKKEVADEYYELKKQELEQRKYKLEMQARKDQKAVEMEERKYALEQQKLEFEREEKRETSYFISHQSTHLRLHYNDKSCMKSRIQSRHATT